MTMSTLSLTIFISAAILASEKPYVQQLKDKEIVHVIMTNEEVLDYMHNYYYISVEDDYIDDCEIIDEILLEDTEFLNER